MVGLLVIFILARIQRSTVHWLLFILFLLPELGFRFVSGSRSQFFFLLLALLIGLYMTSKQGHKVSVRYGRWSVVVVVLIIVFFPLLSFVRADVINLGQILSQSSSFWNDPEALFRIVWSRQHGLDSLAIVIDSVPKDEPYTLGSELALLAVAWIPRQLWPDKPIISIGKVFYEKFYPPIFHEGTAVAVTLPGEFYWAFGLGGVIIGMLFIGVLWRFLFEYLVRPKGNLSNVLVVSSIFTSFFIPVEQTLVGLLTMHYLWFLLVVFLVLTIRGRTIKMEMS